MKIRRIFKCADNLYLFIISQAIASESTIISFTVTDGSMGKTERVTTGWLKRLTMRYVINACVLVLKGLIRIDLFVPKSNQRILLLTSKL